LIGEMDLVLNDSIFLVHSCFVVWLLWTKFNSDF